MHLEQYAALQDRLDGYGSPSWTDAQVARFDGRALPDILDRWSEALVAFGQLGPNPALGDPANFAFGDAVALGVKAAVSRWRQTLRAAGTPTLHVLVPGSRDWWLGTPEDPDAVTVEADEYELFRALAGRRSEDQVRSWTWSAAPAPFLDAGLPYPFTFSAIDLDD